MDNPDLLALIKNSFSEAELKALCFGIGIDYEDLPALGRSGKIIELLRYCHQYDRLPDLLEALAQERPHITWPDPVQPYTLDFLLGQKAAPLLPYEPETVPVSAGSFWMGSDDYEGEAPRHQVELPAYFIGKYPVTNWQYAEFIRQTKRPSPNTPDWFLGQPVKARQDHPVVGVSWYDALDYCQWLSEITGKTYRLPTEAEWEKAARGTDGRIYPWGNEWQEGMCNQGGTGVTAVTAYDAHLSLYGCTDMVGNVQQWTSTLWGSDRRQSDYPYPYRPDAREQLDADDARYRLRRIYRGSIFNDAFSQCRCSARGHDRPKSAPITRGFRLARQP